MLEINKIYCIDCLEGMKELPDNSVDLIVTDPPYNIGKDTWDKISNYSEFMQSMFKESERILKDNGSFYWFHNDMEVIAEFMAWLKQNTHFVFKQMIVWNKRFDNARNKGFLDGFVETGGLRNYQKMVEYIMFYTFQDDMGLTKIHSSNSCFKSIKDYLRREKEKAHLRTCKQINQLLGSDINGGGMASHYFSNKKNHRQWSLPTKEMYRKLQKTGYFQKPYEDLRLEYEELRYTFNNQKTHHSVWNYEIETKNEHITPKPIDLIKNIILHSSNENDLILDPFIGSGTTASACIETNRNYIGMDVEQKWVDVSNKRIEQELSQLKLEF